MMENGNVVILSSYAEAIYIPANTEMRIQNDGGN